MKIAKVQPEFDPIVVWALRTLREELRYRECTTDRVADAIATLDNAGVFAAIDEFTNYEIDEV